tara:strand:+ start:14508 stop:15197 length:690 start_codon:yes stop_codon:yes gene_type:complete
MAGRKFYSVTVKPTMTASKLAVAYGDGDVLFPWTEVPVDRGASRLISITAVVRGTNGARQEFPMDLVFSKSSSENSLGTENATASMYPSNNIIGGHKILATDYGDGLDTFAVTNSSSAKPDLVVAADSGESIYVGGIANGAFDFQSTVQVGTETATNTTAVVVKTTSALINFAAGDVLHDEDDQLIGTISSVTDATNLVLTANCANVSAVNKDLYNINPITLIFGFECA